MSFRDRGGSRVTDFEERDYYSGPPRRGPPPPRERETDVEYYERREESRGPPPARRAPVREYEDIEIRERVDRDRVPNFMREDARRQDTGGPLVLRQRDVETVERRRPRSPSPVHVRERIVERERERPRSLTPPPVRERTRIIEREQEISPDPAPHRPRFYERSPSPVGSSVRVDTRIVERRRERSPTPERERSRVRIVDIERRASPSPSPSPPPAPAPPPPVIRGPIYEREVITHYRDIDHGVERARPPSPPSPPHPIRTKERETDIDIYTSRNETEVDIHKHTRSSSHRPYERLPPPRKEPAYYDEDDLVVEKDHDRLRISETHRRSASAAPPRSERHDYDEEAEYITSKIDERGRMGEARHGATRDWTIVDVPPGTERVRMDGVGGGAAEVTWQRYNGVRRAKFIPDREDTVLSITDSSSAVSEPEPPRSSRERLSVQIYDSHGKGGKTHEHDVEVVEHDRRISIRDSDRGGHVKRRRNENMWTEITRDLVVREAVEKLGYEYEETEYFFYIMQYLRYEDVLELVTVSDSIRRERRARAREIEYEREYRDSWERRRRYRRSIPKWDDYEDERIREREVTWERPIRGYLH